MAAPIQTSAAVGSLRSFSKYFDDSLGIPGPGRPDFAIAAGNEIRWIGDAKFKEDVKRADYRRFLAYVVDLLGPERPSSVLYIGPGSDASAYIRDYEIKHTSLRPRTDQRGRQTLRTTIEQAVGEG